MFPPLKDDGKVNSNNQGTAVICDIARPESLSNNDYHLVGVGFIIRIGMWGILEALKSAVGDVLVRKININTRLAARIKFYPTGIVLV